MSKELRRCCGLIPDGRLIASAILLLSCFVRIRRHAGGWFVLSIEVLGSVSTTCNHPNDRSRAIIVKAQERYPW